MKENLYNYILGIADNSLILGQRLGELCGHGPNLETDIALTNISLDLFGQVRSYYQYAAKLIGENATEDSIAFLRKERDYVNVLLVEQPNSDFAYVMARQFLFDVYHLLMLQELQKSKDLLITRPIIRFVQSNRSDTKKMLDGRSVYLGAEHFAELQADPTFVFKRTRAGRVTTVRTVAED